jgi:hypothetical protein
MILLHSIIGEKHAHYQIAFKRMNLLIGLHGVARALVTWEWYYFLPL